MEGSQDGEGIWPRQVPRCMDISSSWRMEWLGSCSCYEGVVLLVTNGMFEEATAYMQLIM